MTWGRDVILRSTRREVIKALAAAFTLGGSSAFGAARSQQRRAAGGGRITSLNAVLRLVNDSPTTAAVAGTPTNIFGPPFAPGQTPPGHVPVFSADGVAQPSFSANPANARRYWPDGSLMFCAFMLRPTFSVPAKGSKTVTITAAAGAWPTGGARTIQEVLAQKLAINCPPAGLTGVDPQSTAFGGRPFGYGPSAQYSAFVTAANASNLLQTRHWLTGDAGESWCFTYNMSQTAGGAPHGQLVSNIYVIALTNGSGALGGFRFWADLRQPYYDSDGVPKKKAVFAPPSRSNPSLGLNYSINGTTFCPPGWPFPEGGVAFTARPIPAAAGTFAQGVSRGNGFSCYLAADSAPSPTYFGGGGNYETVAVKAVGRSLPSNIDPTIIYFLMTPSDDGHAEFLLSQSAQGPGFTNPNWIGASGLGSGNFVVMPVLQMFGRLSIGGERAQYIFFQGTGAIPTDTPLRSGVPDIAHWVNSGMIPPYNTSLKGVKFGGTITADNTGACLSVEPV